MPGANCQSRANDDKCLSMQIAAAAAAAQGCAGCAAEGESRRGKEIVPQKRNCSCTFLMACMETRLELIGCL